MDCKSLMIGDWLYAYDNKVQVTHLSILGGDIIGVQAPFMSVEKYFASNKVALEHGAKNIKHLKPIPLTAEILEKNGFEYYSIGGAEQWLIKDDYYDIKVYEWSDSIWVFKYDSTEMHIPHTQITLCNTHELQHALRLCEIEKEIEL